MSDLDLDATRVTSILKEVAVDLRSHVEELRELDAKVGDGDLGVTVELGAKALLETVSSGAETDIGKLLAQCGLNINKYSPSTFGTILASAFMGGGRIAMGKTKLELNDLVLIGEGAIENIKKRGKAEAGDKTVIDALVPAVESLKKAIAGGAEAKAAIDEAVRATEEGVKATITMKAKFGRAKWFPDGGTGVQDGGATAMFYMIASFARNLFA